jgi:hypothetical protein
MAAPMEWKSLLSTRDPGCAVRLQTCLLAMEFEARLADSQGRLEPEDDLQDDSPPISDRSLPQPMHVMVRVEDWSALQGVMQEIFEEQDEFDRRIEARRRRVAMIGWVGLAAGGGSVAWWVASEFWG